MIDEDIYVLTESIKEFKHYKIDDDIENSHRIFTIMISKTKYLLIVHTMMFKSQSVMIYLSL